MRNIYLWAVLLAACHTQTEAPPVLTQPSAVSAPASPAATPKPEITKETPASAPASAPTSTPAKVAPVTVVARLVSGDEKPYFYCGVMAFIGVYVYEVEETIKGDPISGRIVVDVLCPEFFYNKTIKLAKGEKHTLSLEPAKKSYAGAIAPASPEAALPRYELKKISL